MAAPTNAAFVKKVLANSEPSTHDPFRKSSAAVTHNGAADFQGAPVGSVP